MTWLVELLEAGCVWFLGVEVVIISSESASMDVGGWAGLSRRSCSIPL